VVVTVTTIFKSGGDKPPSSHTKLRLCNYCRTVETSCTTNPEQIEAVE